MKLIHFLQEKSTLLVEDGGKIVMAQLDPKWMSVMSEFLRQNI